MLQRVPRVGFPDVRGCPMTSNFDPWSLLGGLGQATVNLLKPLAAMVLMPGGALSLLSLLSALAIAVAFWLMRNQRPGRHIPVRVLARALFPRRLRTSRSFRADIGFVIFNGALFGVLFGWALVSYFLVGKAVNSFLVTQFGALAPTTMPVLLAAAILTTGIYLAHEFAYWLDHYLSHKIPFLWEFHKVHHSAEVLTPLTLFRVHPVDTFVYYNISSLMMGTASGVLLYAFGRSIDQITVFDSNVLMLTATYLVGHLQHSHVWIAFTGVWGRILLSPAHHQIHHSTNPLHFDTNLGNSLAIWDWMFGTLHMPQKQREPLRFGVDPKTGEEHTLMGAMVRPFARAMAHLASARPWPAAIAGLVRSRPARERAPVLNGPTAARPNS